MKKINLGVYPFEESLIPILRYKELFGKCRFCRLIKHNGVDLSENEIKEISTYAKEYDQINWEDLNSDSDLDMLLVTGDVEKLEWDVAIGVIEKYCKNGIGVLLMGVYTIKEKIQEICDSYGVPCKTNDEIPFASRMMDYKNMKYSLTQQTIETPIVSVAGVVPVTQRYQIQLDLLNNFKNDGYKVILIGTGCLNELMDSYSINDVLFCKNLSEVHRIYYFNNFLKEIEKQEKPDLIIIGIDDPLLPLSSRHPFNYGIYASELYSAFTPDVSIIALMNGTYNDEFYEEFGKLCHFKYNFEASAYFVSRYVPLSASMYREKLSYAFADTVPNTSDKYTVFSNEDIEQKSIYNFVLKKLQQFGRCEQF